MTDLNSINSNVGAIGQNSGNYNSNSNLFAFAWKSSKLFQIIEQPSQADKRFLINPNHLSSIFNEDLTSLFIQYKPNIWKSDDGKTDYIMFNGGHCIYPIWKLKEYSGPYVCGVCCLIRVTYNCKNLYFINMGVETGDVNATGYSHETSTCWEIQEFLYDKNHSNGTSSEFYPLITPFPHDIMMYPLTFKYTTSETRPTSGPSFD